MTARVLALIFAPFVCVLAFGASAWTVLSSWYNAKVANSVDKREQ